MNVLDKLETLGPESVEDPYVPYVAALEQGIIQDPERMAERLSNPPGVSIANGLIPNNKGAGIIPVGDTFGAFDLTRVVFHGKDMEVTPTPKSAVDHDTGRITEEGGIVLELGDGRIKLAGLAIDVQTRPWLAMELLKDRFQYLTQKVAVVALSSFDLPEYEITEVDTDTGVLRAIVRNRVFGF